MQLPEAWIQTALRITGHFEDSADPLGGVSGDFDGMGISLGVLQWNIGSGSLQPLVKKAGRVAVLDAMPVFGTDLWTACNGSIPQGLKIVRAWQHGQALQPKIKTELKSFAHSEAFIAQQVNAAHKVAEASWMAAIAWDTSANRGDPTVQEFCWFFDVMTQNGGLKGISSSDVENFITATGSDRADDLVCDWLAARTNTDNGFRDSRKNAQLWRDAVPEEQLLLFVASYLRSQKSKLVWQADTLNRKGTIALGIGWAHGEKHELNAIFNATS